MKKLVTLTLAILLAFSFAGCGTKKDGIGTMGKYEGIEYPRFLATDWGMTKEETCKALGIDEADFKLTQPENDEHTTVIVESEVYTAKLKIEGVETNVTFIYPIYRLAEGTQELGLIRIVFETADKNIVDKVKEQKAKITTTKENDVYSVLVKKDYVQRGIDDARAKYDDPKLVIDEKYLVQKYEKKPLASIFCEDIGGDNTNISYGGLDVALLKHFDKTK